MPAARAITSLRRNARSVSIRAREFPRDRPPKCGKNPYPLGTSFADCSFIGKRWRTAMCKSFVRHAIVAAACLIAFSVSSAWAQGITQPKQGQGGSVVKGSAGTDGSSGDIGLEHCDKPMGAMAVVEPQSEILASLTRYRLSSPVGLIRMMIQQSACFIVVERGAGMQNLMQERQLAQGGEMRQGSNLGGGQMVAADFVMTPSVVFSEGNAGGIGGAAGGLLGGKFAAVAGGLKFKEAQTSMLVADSRSGVGRRRR